jgi:hypothetical protein
LAFSITGKIPGAVSARTAAAIFQPQGGLHYDVSIAELPFVYAINDSMPYTRETIDFKRQQIDTSPEPGEQTLSQWWTRDEDSWHRGAGINWYEPGSDPTTRYRFYKSIGIDPWTRGQVTLENKMVQLQSTTVGNNAYATAAVVNGADCVFTVVGGQFFRSDGLTNTAYTSVPVPGTEPAVAGAKVLVGSTAGVLAGDVTGASLATLWSTASGNTARPWWVKNRIICAMGPALYDLTMAGGSIDSSTPLWTHPSTTWTWTDVTECPGAIIACGHDGGYGFIYRFVLDQTTGGTSLPTLSKAIQTATFPPGETVYSVEVYLGSYIAIGTSRGVRIGNIDTSGVIQYGPLTIETTKPVRALSARNTYVYAGIEADIDGGSGAARINLSEEITTDITNLSAATRSTLRFAWAYGVQSHTTGAVQSVAFLGVTDRVVLGVQGNGVYLESATLYESSGYIQTGKIRFATSEPKSFRLIKVRSQVLSSSSITVSTIDQADTVEECFTIGADFNSDIDITLKNIADVRQSHAAIKMKLTASSDNAVTPILQSYQLKATPIPRIQRLIKMPLWLMDKEQDRNGGKFGYAGQAWTKLQALEQMEQERSVVLVNDWTSGESFTAQIKAIHFQRSTPPARNQKNFGGVLLVELIKL